MLLAAIMAFGIQAGTDARYPTDPADWGCASPLIERNFRRNIDADQLALRIADECTRAYQPRPIRSDADRAFEGMERTTYGYQSATFVLEIEQRILQARRRATIHLD